MITSYHPSRTFRPLGIAHASLMVALALSPAWIRQHLDERNRTQTVVEFQSTRHQLLTTIEAAANRNDLDSLIAIDRRYSDVISDRPFKAALREALANAAAHHKELELHASRNLDLARHQAEVSWRPDTSRPQLPEDHLAPNRLSVLP